MASIRDRAGASLEIDSRTSNYLTSHQHLRLVGGASSIQSLISQSKLKRDDVS